MNPVSKYHSSNLNKKNSSSILFLILDDLLKTTMVDKIPSDLEGMEVSMQRLLALIDDVYKYVDEVVVSKMALSYLFHFCFLVT